MQLYPGMLYLTGFRETAMYEGAFGERLGRSFRISDPPTLQSQTKRGSRLAATELRIDKSGYGMTSPMGNDDAYLICLNLKRQSTEWWSNYVSNMLPFALLTIAAWAAVAGIAMTTDARYALIGFSALSAVTMLFVALPTRVTALGRYIVWSATQHHSELKTARMEQGDALDIKTLGQAIGLYGPDALAGSDMAWIPAVLAQTSTSD